LLNDFAFLSGFSPRFGKSTHHVRVRNLWQQLKACHNDFPMKLIMKRHTELMPHPKWNEQESWRFGVIGHIQCNRW